MTEQAAFGWLGFAPDVFYEMTPAQFFNAQIGKLRTVDPKAADEIMHPAMNQADKDAYLAQMEALYQKHWGKKDG